MGASIVRRALNFFVSMVVLCLGSAIPAKADAPDDPCEGQSSDSVIEQIQELDLDLRRALFSIRQDAMSGRFNSFEAASLLHEFDIRFERLKKLAEECDRTGVGQAKRKMAALRGRLQNLRIASTDAASAAKMPDLDDPLMNVRPKSLKVAPDNDACLNAIDVGFGVVTGNTLEAANDGEATCGGSLRSPDVWYRFVATESKRVHVDTAGSDFDTVLSVHRECPGNLDNDITCNDDAFGLQSSVAFEAVAGEDYLVRIAGMNGAVGNYQLRITEGAEIVGTVSSSESGSPLEGVELLLYRGDQYNSWHQTTFTSALGEYQFASLGSDNWRLRTLGAHPYVDELYGGTPCLPDIGPCTCTRCACELGMGAVIATEVDGPPVVADFDLDMGGTVSGTVTDNTGSPADEVTVDILEPGQSCVAGRAVTDATGAWSVTGLPSGSYRATATAFNYLFDELFDDVSCEGGVPNGCSLSEGTPIAVLAGETPSDIDFSLDLTPAIGGHVVSAVDGSPIRYRRIDIYHIDGSSAGAASTNSSGTYRWFAPVGTEGAPPQYYYVGFENYHDGHNAKLFDDIDCQSLYLHHCDILRGSIVSVDRGSPALGIDFTVEKSAAIEGAVSFPGGPASYVEVKLWDHAGGLLQTAQTDFDGEYRFPYLKAGTYYLATDLNRENDQLYAGVPCPLGVPFGCAVTDGLPIELAPETTTSGIDFVLAEPSDPGLSSISGVVASAIDGNPYQTRVMVYDLGGTEASSPYYLTDIFGRYRIENIPAGSYFVEAGGRECPFADAPMEPQLYDGVACPSGWISGGCNILDAEPVVTTPEAPARHINFSLRPADGIRVLVTDKVTGELVEGVAVTLWNAGGLIETDSTRDGAAVFNCLEPDTYYVMAKQSGYFEHLYDGLLCTGGPGIGCLPQEGTPIVLSEGEGIKEIHLELDPGATIEGTVRSARDNSPLSASTSLWDEDGKLVGKDGGRFWFRGLLPGTYYLSAIAARHRDELYPDVPCPGGPPTGCSLTDGEPIVIEDSGVYSGFDLALDLLGEISGMTYDEDTGRTIEAYATLFDSSREVVDTESSYDGGPFEFTGLERGVYWLLVQSEGYDTELYDDVSCPGGVGTGCGLAQGTPISIEHNRAPESVEMRLRPSPGTISGTVVDEDTGEPIPWCRVSLGLMGGNLNGRPWVWTKFDGSYLFSGLMPGEYLVGVHTATHHIEEVYDGLTCPRLNVPPYWTCDPTKGTPVVVPPKGAATGIDFALEADFQGLRGLVTDEEAGQRLKDVYVDIWDANSHVSVATTPTDSWGRFATELDVGSYLVSTDAGAQHVDQLYLGVECPAGPAYLGLCDLSPGSAVEISDDELRSDIDFVLRSSLIKTDGFESGDLSSWIVYP